MEVTFADPALDDLERDVKCKTRLGQPIVRAYRKAMRFIRDAVDERDLRFPGLRFEKLKGKRSHQRSIRLNDQWRLVFEITEGNPTNIVHIVSIEDYH